MQIGILKVTRHLLGLAWLVLTVLLVGTGAVSQLAGHFDRQVYVVRGGSMSPSIPIGSVIFARPVAPEELQIGDVVTIREDDGNVVTHRITELRVSYLGDLVMRTRGDANSAADAPIRLADSVIGEVDEYVPWLGFLITFLSMPSGIVATLAAMGTLLLARWWVEDLIRPRSTRPMTVAWEARRRATS